MIRPTLNINYYKVKNQASRIRQLSSELGSKSGDINHVMNQMVTIWEGDAAKEYINQSYQLEREITYTKNRMYQLANKIEQAARGIRNDYERRLDRYKTWKRKQEENN